VVVHTDDTTHRLTNTRGSTARTSGPQGRSSSPESIDDRTGVQHTDDNDTADTLSKLRSLGLRLTLTLDHMGSVPSDHHSWLRHFHGRLTSIRDESVSLFNEIEVGIAHQVDTNAVIPEGRQIAGGVNWRIAEVDARLTEAGGGQFTRVHVYYGH
jgi:hypothetical protein